MKRSMFLRKMDEWDRKGRRVYTLRDLRSLFPEDSALAFRNAVARLVDEKDAPLKRVMKNVYVYAASRHPWTHVAEEIARTIRRGHHTYVSLESALSEHGVISQIPVKHLTMITTGRPGKFEVGDIGTLEFTHTGRAPREFLTGLLDVGRPLPLATRDLALEDIRRIGRNLHLIQDDEPEEETCHGLC
ncbi:hypothetical protein LAZ40_10925 [Cereibacter sphaeroides]|uniref:type IV toxin-antitoxin system AbiEi family antitoxin n=1 Tax=Cereibacter sphaeroides TaxID=1063 RepID=UPI001F2C9167|nr:hypothetical protein [Cereibacter sphaeroides]MCE6959568.1 hypothetical protein [Cereibacter sphaeroides]MCE6974572.1 hypothetical protein [Cereibacter sphaeroides]